MSPNYKSLRQIKAEAKEVHEKMVSIRSVLLNPYITLQDKLKLLNRAEELDRQAEVLIEEASLFNVCQQ